MQQKISPSKPAFTVETLRALIEENRVLRSGRRPMQEKLERAANRLNIISGLDEIQKNHESYIDQGKRHIAALEALLHFYEMLDDAGGFENPFAKELRNELKAVKEGSLLWERMVWPSAKVNYHGAWRHIALPVSDAFTKLVEPETYGISADGPRVRFVTVSIQAITGESPSLANVAHHLKTTKR